ncbi:Protein DYAD [Quillaja saponaria]|uniref:Protein DYAD n=1 Tax=Quillaja saponaria TaxID=32244 RepID=A0AAD7LFA2_QUISA|nr:Protein DYAD [Quillaja saponaria]
MEKTKLRLLGSIPKEEDVKDEDEDVRDEDVKTVNAKMLFIPEFKKRKRLGRDQLRELKAALDGRKRKCSRKDKKKRPEARRDRWSAERYKLAEQSMLEILKAEGATFTNPISRPDLRVAARKYIGDTGLLDHLLKHIDGKVAPGGTERFRRWFGTNGVMEYWLESSDLDSIRQEAGVQDPYWIPPSRFTTGAGPSQELTSSGELMLLKEEMIKMRRDMELILKKQEPSETNLMEETHKELVKWKAMTEQRLSEITTSLKGMQGMYTRSPEKWEDWLASSNLDNMQGDELLPWFGNADLLNVEQEAVVQDHYLGPPPQFTACGGPSQDSVCLRELQLLKEEMASMKRNVLELAPKKQEEEQANVTPDSCITVNSNSEVDNSLILFQEMFMELFKWKEKMEQQLLEVSNAVYGMLAMK